MLAGVFSSGFLVLFVLFWELYLSILSLIVFFAAWQFINVIFYTKIATIIHQYKRNDNISLSDTITNPYAVVHLDDLGTKNIVDNSHHLIASETDTNVIKTKHDYKEDDETVMIKLMQPSVEDTPFTHSTSIRISRDDSQTAESLIYKEPEPTELPPYSIAIISVVTINVVIQVILQIVLFSYLQYSLHIISIILVIMYIISTIMFILGSTIFSIVE
jgi:hypothetical protein